MAREIPAVERLQQIPGVGPITSLYFVLSIDDPHRFRRSRDVAAFFGLRPSMRESGGASHYGRITKEGDPEMRRLLVQAKGCRLGTKTSRHGLFSYFERWWNETGWLCMRGC